MVVLRLSVLPAALALALPLATRMEAFSGNKLLKNVSLFDLIGFDDDRGSIFEAVTLDF